MSEADGPDVAAAADLAAEASAGAGDAAGAADPGAPDAPGDPQPDPTGGETPNLMVRMLTETEPDDHPANHPDEPEHRAHALIGFKKSLNALTGEAADGGTPALYNYVMAGVGWVRRRRAAQADADADADADDWGEA
jgi:hypothetical protein